MNLKTKLMGSILMLICCSTWSQIVINSLDSNGEIRWSGVSTGDLVCIQWDPAVTGPWHSSWDGLCSIMMTSSVGRASVPMFYRIIRNPASPTPVAGVLTDRTGTNINTSVLRFVQPAGNGRGHRAGVLAFGNSSFDAFGSTWEFDYQRDDWGVQVVHPFNSGQFIITLHRATLGLSAPSRWLEIGYGSGDTNVFTHTPAFTNVFPLLNATNYHVKTVVTPGGIVSVSLNGSLVATGAVSSVHPIDFNVGTNETFEGESVWDTRQFTGAGFPLLCRRGTRASSLNRLIPGITSYTQSPTRLGLRVS